MTDRTVKLGESIVIELDNLASAGYNWLCEYDNAKLEVVQTSKPKIINSPPGKAYVTIFTITGKQKGIAHVVFKQLRIWDEKSQVKKEKCYIVVE